MHKQHLVSVDIRGGTLLVAKAVYSPSEVTVIDTSLNHKGKKQKNEKKNHLSGTQELQPKVQVFKTSHKLYFLLTLESLLLSSESSY